MIFDSSPGAGKEIFLLLPKEVHEWSKLVRLLSRVITNLKRHNTVISYIFHCDPWLSTPLEACRHGQGHLISNNSNNNLLLWSLPSSQTSLPLLTMVKIYHKICGTKSCTP